MNKEAIIECTMRAIHHLPEEKAKEISDFAEFKMKQYEEDTLTKGIAQIVSDSQTFNYLNDEDDIYTETDIKEPYNG